MKLHLSRLAASLAALALTAPAAAHADGGNEAVNSIGTVQVGAVTVDPNVTIANTAVADEISVAGNTQVGGDGSNSASNSVGTVQVGGGNSADRSAVTVQASNVKVDPRVTVRRSPFAKRVTVSRDTRVGGGGNAANRSLGTVQASNVDVDPKIAIDGSPIAKSAGVNGGTHIGGGGNDARKSVGTVQLGGGNSADRSLGTAQASNVNLNPKVAIDGSPIAKNAGVNGGTQIGGRGNSAGKSIGSLQFGGGNAADRSAATAQAGSITVDPVNTNSRSAVETTMKPSAHGR